MNLKNKIVLITGASSGIGKAAAYQFAEQGAKLILTARRIEKLNELSKEINDKYHVDVLPLQLDVQVKEQVKLAIKELPKEWRNIDILINNAGLALDSCKIQDGNLENWDTMINTNLNGLLYMTREILPNMIARNAGHIINIGSVAGHEYYGGGNIYSATKHAVKAISKSLRIDLLGTAIRVTEIDPGAVNTEFSEVRWKDKRRADDFYKDFDALTGDDIADAMVYCATRPLHVDVAEMIIFPTAQASCNHIHKQGAKQKSIFD